MTRLDGGFSLTKNLLFAIIGHKEKEMASLAEQIFEVAPAVKTENELLDLGFERMRKEQGIKAARYSFWYDEDFPSDFVSEYFWLQRKAKVD